MKTVTKTGVYRIVNLITGRSYYGSTRCRGGFGRRWSQHRDSLKRKICTNAKLQAAWNKYGKEHFIFEIVEICQPENCIEREQWYLDNVIQWGFDYNVRKIAESNIGNFWPDSIAAKIRKYGYDIHRNTVDHRINKLGWDEERACTTPSKQHKNCLKNLIKQYGNVISYTGALYRVHKLGWDHVRASSTPLQKSGRKSQVFIT